MTIATQRASTAFCSVLARDKGLDPIGLATPRDYFLIVETPLPWGPKVFQTADLPPEVPAIIAALTVNPERRVRLRPLLIAPDPAYSVPGHRRVIYLRRPAASAVDPFTPVPETTPPFSQFVRREYLVPDAETGPLCHALFNAPDTLPRFDRWLQQTDHIRDFLVCTHFGAHVCAPTLIEIPDGRFWGFIEEDETRLLTERQGDITRLRDCYRGWRGHSSPWLQVAEREAMLREGWDWFGFVQAGEVLAEGASAASESEPAWGEVRPCFTDPATGRCGAYEARIERIAPLVTIATTGKDNPRPFPQYQVARFESIY